MLRGRAVAAALCVLVPAARADLFGQDEDLCARVDAEHSNMWEDQAHGLRTGAASETVDELSARRSRILSRAQRNPDLELLT